MNAAGSSSLFSGRTLAWSLGAVLVVFGLSVVVGFLGGEHGFGWELAAVFGTALGTTLLAITTGLLALLTWRDVSAAQELARLTRDEAANTKKSLRMSRRQGETARAALDAQTQPFLSVGDTSPGFLNPTHVHVRNVGAGMAIVTTAVFISATETLPAGAVDPAMPPGESTSLRAAQPFADGDVGNFSVAVGFADASGRARGAVRLDVYRRERAPVPEAYEQPDTWWVRQIHWADTIEDVRERPKFASQPVD